CASTGDQQAALSPLYSKNLLTPALIRSSPSRKSVSSTSALACTTTRLALSWSLNTINLVSSSCFFDSSVTCCLAFSLSNRALSASNSASSVLVRPTRSSQTLPDSNEAPFSFCSATDSNSFKALRIFVLCSSNVSRASALPRASCTCRCSSLACTSLFACSAISFDFC